MKQKIRAIAATIIGVAVIVGASGCQSATTQPTGTKPPAARSTSAATSSPNCDGQSLSARVGTSGDALGTQVTQILVTNEAASPCRVGGLPELFGVEPDGKATVLGYKASSDSSVVRQPPGGAGVLSPGARAEIIVIVQLNNCPTSNASGPPYTRLEIRLHSGATVDMPFPAALAGPGCPAMMSQIGLMTG